MPSSREKPPSEIENRMKEQLGKPKLFGFKPVLATPLVFMVALLMIGKINVAELLKKRRDLIPFGFLRGFRSLGDQEDRARVLEALLFAMK